MGAVKIPIDRLTPEILQGVIEEFITREGTDYGKIEVPLDTKLRQVKELLESGMAVLIYRFNLNNLPCILEYEYSIK